MCRLFEFLAASADNEADESEQKRDMTQLHIERQESIDDNLRNTPGFKFITRLDLYQYARVS